MAKRTVPQRVEEFRRNNPKAKFMIDDMNEIMELDSTFNRIMTAFYFGYMKGQKSGKGGAGK